MDLSKLSNEELDRLIAEKESAESGSSELKHHMGWITRALVNGVSQPLSMVGEHGPGKVIREAMGIPTFQKVVEGGMDTAGLAKPEGTLENILSSGVSALPLAGVGAAATGAKLGASLLSGGASGLAGGAAHEMGLPGYMQVIAALLGGGAPQAGAKVAQGTWHGVQPYIPGQIPNIESRTLGNAVGDRRDAVINALETAPREMVPGSKPTAAQVATPAGSTELSGLEKILASKYDPSGYNSINEAQETARGTWAGFPKTPGGQAVPMDEARAALNDKYGNIGAPRAASLVAESMDPVGKLPNALYRPMMIARYLAMRAKGAATEKTLIPLTQDMKDPDKILELLKNAPPQQQGQLLEALKAYLAGTAAGTAEVK